MTKTNPTNNATAWERFSTLGEAIDAAVHRDPTEQLSASLRELSQKVKSLEAKIADHNEAHACVGNQD